MAAILARVRRGVIVFSLAVLASCGFSPGSAEAVAARIGCEGFQSVPAPRLATDAGRCSSFYFETVKIVYFDGNDAQDEWVTSASEEGPKFIGDQFVIEGPERTLREMRNVIDGEVRP
jgi:hypothetical protein